MSTIRQGVLAARRGPAEILPEGGIQQHFSFGPEFIGFAGHFPNEPILPAVVQIQMGVLLAETLQPSGVDAVLVLESVRKAKFVRKLLPGERILACCRQCGGREYCFDLALSVNHKAAASARLCFVRRSNGGVRA